MKKVMKLLLCTLIMTLMFTMTGVFASFDNSGITITPTAPGNAANTANSILGVMQWLGYAISVGMLIYVGIKYVMASADEKASLKNSLIKFVVGAVLIAGATTIASWVFKIV